MFVRVSVFEDDSMIGALFWYTGLVVWAWIAFLCLLAPLVAFENRLVIKR